MIIRIRALSLLAACLAAILLVTPAHARQHGTAGATPGPRADGSLTQRFVGQVATTLGPAASPTGLAVQQQDGKTVAIHLDARTILRARTAEAQVEGLTAGDFAVVQAIKVGTDWTARRVVFDVDPFGPIQNFTVIGSVVRLNRPGTQVLLAIPGGTTRWIILTRNTHYSLDGIPIETTPALPRNSVLSVDVHVTVRGWVAQAINLRTSRGTAQGR